MTERLVRNVVCRRRKDDIQVKCPSLFADPGALVDYALEHPDLVIEYKAGEDVRSSYIYVNKNGSAVVSSDKPGEEDL